MTQESHSELFGITVDQPHNIHQKDLEFFQLENTLSSASVVPCLHKEHVFVSKRLKNLAEQEASGPKRHLIVPIKSSSQEELAKNPCPEQWERFKEERQFQISRM